MFNGVVEAATPADYAWIKELWDKHDDVLLPFEDCWKAYQRFPRTHFFEVARPQAGAQYYKIEAGRLMSRGAVVATKRQGVAKALRISLLRHGLAVEFYISPTNTESLIAHDRMGFTRANETAKRIKYFTTAKRANEILERLLAEREAQP
jgi:hypothetical protein